jgi:hypothetical protein
MFRNIVCGLMVALFPLSLIAADSGPAMMYSNGSAWLNGSGVPRSSAVFPGDLVQTKAGAMAKISSPGVTVAVLSDSLIKFEGSTVSVDHGSVAVGTSKGTATHLGEITVSPASSAWTEFQVSQADGKVQIMAHKGDVSINDPSGTTTLSQGRQTTRYASSSQRRGGAAPAAGGGVLDSPIVVAAGLAAIGGLAIWVLSQGSEPASPVIP